ncbi:MAG: DUF2062 domain-containing protein [Gammaproteobacteria bacterium]|nr:MAG: DUF2062 domain-containing protein [Gammaproteobacteria bacterium]
MPRKFLKQLLPKDQKLREDQQLKLFGTLLHNPNLWHLTRSSVANAVSVGLLIAFVPAPGQMLLAAATAILIGCNLPIAVVGVWASNPLTMPPLCYGAYKVGTWLLGEVPHKVQFEISLEWLTTQLGGIWQPFLLGCLICGLAGALAGNICMRVIWRLHVRRRWHERRARRGAESRTV